MPLVCLYFQIHQPFRLRKYTVFDSDPNYFDNSMNAQLVRRIAERCYIPMNRMLLELIQNHGGRFKLALSVTGTALEQFESYAPEVLQGLHALAQTRCVEFLSETYYHSLASLHSETEFRQQVDLHQRMIRRLFGQTPAVFRNTELIYSNRIAGLAQEMGFRGILTEGWEPALNNRSAAFIYRAIAAAKPGQGGADARITSGNPLYLLLRNHRLSDAIAFRFADSRSPDFPLTEDKFSSMVSQIGGRLCNLFMDYETFGEHQPADTGILDFMHGLTGKLMEHHQFALPTELVGGENVETAGELDVPSPISWADESRDLGAWMGNAMQTDALASLYGMEEKIKAKGDGKLLAEWRKLTTSDHFYYMSTKDKADGSVHSYFRPYDSPYDAYINFMNVLDNLRARVG
ncbi:MAG TPA: glycoside hydrolase family 57 protein [Phycisphaerae bacterium]